MKLTEAFSNPDSIAEGAIMFVDITDSTNMKEKDAEAAWLTTYGWFFDLVTSKIEESGGRIVKYLGDGVMAYYDLACVASAINAAILIQETLNVAARERHVFVNCTIGIATGRFRSFQAPNGATDYIGNVVDVSARLCSVASSKAVFVDKATVNSAMMIKVKSMLGEMLGWSVDDYIGDQQRILLKGLSQPVAYHEIRWNQQLYGIKSEVATRVLNRTNPPALQHSERPDAPPQAKLFGSVHSWKSENGFGFITEQKTKTHYYTSRYYLTGEQELAVGDHVFFLDREPLKADAKRLAAAVVVVGQRISGTVTFVNYKNKERQIAAVDVLDHAGNAIGVYAFLGPNDQGITRGDKLEFEIAFDERGPAAKGIIKT